MEIILLDLFTDFASQASFTQSAAQTATPIFLNPLVLGIGIVLIIASIFVIFFLKKIITNSILGGIIWFASIFVFKVELPLLPSFVISVIFGPAGIGTMLILKFFGLMV